MRNRDELEGKADQLKGRIKEGVGKMTGDADLEGEGLGDQAAGTVQETFGRGKRKVGEAIEDVGKAVKR